MHERLAGFAPSAYSCAAVLQKLERRFGRYALSDFTWYLVGGQAIAYAFAYAKPEFVEKLILIPAFAYREPWRFVSFLFTPPASSPIFVIFALYFAFMFGNALEHAWGAFRYNVYVFVAWAATVVSALFVPNGMTSNAYIAGSIFLAFAHLNPNFQMYIFFVLPIRVKWLAGLTLLGYGYTLAVGDWAARANAIAALFAYLLFFGRDLWHLVRTGHRRMTSQVQGIKAKREEEKKFTHQCVTCGRTDKDDPKLQFRYAEINGSTKCYCMDHLKASIRPPRAG